MTQEASGGGVFNNVLWVLVTLEMALRVDVISFLVFLWLVVQLFWKNPDILLWEDVVVLEVKL